MTAPQSFARGPDGRWQAQTLATSPAPFGSYLPDPVCAGVLPNVPRDKHPGDYTAKPGEVIRNVEFERLHLTGSAILTNVKAQAVKPAGSEQGVIANSRKDWLVELFDCEVASAFPTHYDGRTYGAGWVGFHATRTYFHDLVDGIDGFIPGGDAPLNIRTWGCLIDRLLVGPVPASIHPDLVTHTDPVQIQGSGDFEDVGSYFRCMSSPLSPYATGAMAKKYGYPHANGSCLAVTPNTAKVTRPVKLTNTWLAGGRRLIGIVTGPKDIAPGMVQLDGVKVFKSAGTVTGEWIVTQKAAYLDAGNVTFCDDRGISVGQAVPIKVGLPS